MISNILSHTLIHPTFSLAISEGVFGFRKWNCSTHILFKLTVEKQITSKKVPEYITKAIGNAIKSNFLYLRWWLFKNIVDTL